MAKTAKDPMTAIREMSMNRPEMRQVFEKIQQNGGDPRAAVYAEARNRGIDPQEAFRQAQQMVSQIGSAKN